MLAKYITLNIDFKIPPVINNISDTHLLVEIGNSNISFLVYEKCPFHILGLYMHKIEDDFSTNKYIDTLKNIIDENELLKSSFFTIKIFYNVINATLVPTQYYLETEKENILNVMFGENKSTYCFKENVKGNEIKLVYRIPARLYEFVHTQFSKSTFNHSSSSQIDLLKSNASLLKCIIYNQAIKLLLFIDGNIQIVQFFNYETPTDVSYHLLNVCKQFNVDVKNINVELSGLIEEKSNLYLDIYKYFLNISFATINNEIVITEALNKLPQHYYSTLVELAQCV